MDDRRLNKMPDKYINFAFYAITVLAIIGLKLFYERSDNRQLMFILWPLSKMVSLFYNAGFSFDLSLGYISQTLNITIGHDCAGMNFLIILFSMLSFSFIHRIKSLGGKIAYIIGLLPLSYLFSVIINGFRIIVSVMVKRTAPLSRLISKEVAHNLTGMLIFIGFLLAINYGFSAMFKKMGGNHEKTA